MPTATTIAAGSSAATAVLLRRSAPRRAARSYALSLSRLWSSSSSSLSPPAVPMCPARFLRHGHLPQPQLWYVPRGSTLSLDGGTRLFHRRPLSTSTAAATNTTNAHNSNALDEEEDDDKGAAGPASPSSSSQSTTTPSAPSKAAKKTTRRSLPPMKDPIVVTDRAALRLRELLDGPSGQGATAIRLGVRRRGCNGLSYTLDYVRPIPPSDDDVGNNKNTDPSTPPPPPPKPSTGKLGSSRGDSVMMAPHNVIVHIEPMALFSVVGTVMDWTETELTSEFTFTNPNSKGECGCGESFTV